MNADRFFNRRHAVQGFQILCAIFSYFAWLGLADWVFGVFVPARLLWALVSLAFAAIATTLTRRVGVGVAAVLVGAMLATFTLAVELGIALIHLGFDLSDALLSLGSALLGVALLILLRRYRSRWAAV